jgi:hypothetical protein
MTTQAAERTRSIEEVVARLERVLDGLPESDANRWFASTYLRTTLAVGKAIRSGRFADSAWVERLDVVFADMYLDAVEAHRAGERPSQPWSVAFEAAAQSPDLPPLRHVLLGINAHINYDLPQALLAVMSDDDFDDPLVLAVRKRDHEMIDSILSSRVAAEEIELGAATGGVTTLDRLLRPLNRSASRRFLKEAREKVWSNAIALSRARRSGWDDLEIALNDLSEASVAKLEQLVNPGQILIKLGTTGFGVTLAPAKARRAATDRAPAPHRSFDPRRVGTLERDAWVAYYQRRWGSVLVGCVRLIHIGFRMDPLSTLRGAWHVLRAGQLWSPYPENDPSGTRRHIARFYKVLNRSSGEYVDPAEAARLEVQWWHVHRRIQRDPDQTEFVEADLTSAVADLYEYLYKVPRAQVLEAAQDRVQAMVLSDRWVEDGCHSSSPYLAAEGSALVRSYARLLAAVHR